MNVRYEIKNESNAWHVISWLCLTATVSVYYWQAGICGHTSVETPLQKAPLQLTVLKLMWRENLNPWLEFFHKISKSFVSVFNFHWKSSRHDNVQMYWNSPNYNKTKIHDDHFVILTLKYFGFESLLSFQGPFKLCKYYIRTFSIYKLFY